MKPRRPEVSSIHDLSTEGLVEKTSVVRGITKPHDVPVSDMAVSGFRKGMHSYHKKAPSVLQETPNIRADKYVATDVETMEVLLPLIVCLLFVVGEYWRQMRKLCKFASSICNCLTLNYWKFDEINFSIVKICC